MSHFVPGSVFVAVPAVSWMYTNAVHALLSLRLPPGSCVVFDQGSTDIAAKRNHCVESFLARPEYEWLLFLDSDMTPPPDAVTRLLSHGKPVVGALCYTRNPPYRTCAGWYDAASKTAKALKPKQGLAEVGEIGTGCLLIHRAVFETLPAPWFEYLPNQPGHHSDGVFARKVRAAGIPVFCDSDLIVGHLTVVPVPTAEDSPVPTDKKSGLVTIAKRALWH